MWYVAGVVINPKNAEPVLVGVDSADEIDVHRLNPNAARIGSGEFEPDDEAAAISGLPRANTAGGVKPKGKGYGTTLYTGLCLAAHLQHEGRLHGLSEEDGDGISSWHQERSKEATGWWTRAVDLGLVIRDHVAQEVEEEFGPGDLAGCQTSEDGYDVDVEQARGEVTKIEELDLYPYRRADGADLVLCAFDPPDLDDYDPDIIEGLDGFRKELEETDGYELEEAEIAPILACDPRGLAPSAFELLVTVLRLSGADEPDIDAFRLRYDFDLDPDVPMGPIVEAKKPLTRKLPISARPNPSERRHLERIARETAELRDSLMWSELEALP